MTNDGKIERVSWGRGHGLDLGLDPLIKVRRQLHLGKRLEAMLNGCDHIVQPEAIACLRAAQRDLVRC
eukprot:14869396-Alexandrium_andersonii.AAC.1